MHGVDETGNGSDLISGRWCGVRVQYEYKQRELLRLVGFWFATDSSVSRSTQRINGELRVRAQSRY